MRLKVRFLKLPKMLGYFLSRTEEFQQMSAIKRLQNLLPKYRIRESQRFIQRFTGEAQESPRSGDSDAEDKALVENFFIRKQTLNQCSAKRAGFKESLLKTFLKLVAEKLQIKRRLCLLKLGEVDSRASRFEGESQGREEYFEEPQFALEEQYNFGEEDSEKDFSDEEGAPSVEESFGEEAPEAEHFGMPKIEETFEESVEDSRLDSPIRKMGKTGQALVDSQIFRLKLSKIQKAGEEHRFIEAEAFNFTSNETGGLTRDQAVQHGRLALQLQHQKLDQLQPGTGVQGVGNGLHRADEPEQARARQAEDGSAHPPNQLEQANQPLEFE